MERRENRVTLEECATRSYTKRVTRRISSNVGGTVNVERERVPLNEASDVKQGGVTPIDKHGRQASNVEGLDVTSREKSTAVRSE